MILYNFLKRGSKSFKFKKIWNDKSKKYRTPHFEIVSPAAMISIFYVISVENHARVAVWVDKMDKPFMYLLLLRTCMCILLFVAADTRKWF